MWETDTGNTLSALRAAQLPPEQPAPAPVDEAAVPAVPQVQLPLSPDEHPVQLQGSLPAQLHCLLLATGPEQQWQLHPASQVQGPALPADSGMTPPWQQQEVLARVMRAAP
jgi:hypothetical protein